MNRLKRCYLTFVDDDFDKSSDVIAGRWCLANLANFTLELENCIIPDEINFLNDKELSEDLYNLSIKVLDVYLKEKKIEKNEESYHFFISYIFHAVFTIFSKIFLVENMLKKVCIQTYAFEKVEKPEISSVFTLDFDPVFGAYIINLILQTKYAHKRVKWFRNTHNEQQKVDQEALHLRKNKLSLSDRLKNLNSFRFVPGIKYFQGILLTALACARDLFFPRKISRIGYLKHSPIRSTYLKESEELIKKLVVLCLSDCADFFLKDKHHDLSMKQYIPRVAPPSVTIYNPQYKRAILSETVNNNQRYSTIQHGACYGTLKACMQQEIERTFTNFISWGDTIPQILKTNTQNVKLPSPHINHLAKMKRVPESIDFLWITGVSYFGGNGIAFLNSEGVVSYLNKKLALAKNLRMLTKNRFIYKTLPMNKYEFDDPVKDLLSEENIVCKGSATELMRLSKLTFVDYYGTPFYEAMAMNRPVVMASLEFKPNFTYEAQFIFDKFKRAGVFCETVDDAVKQLIKLHQSNIQKWWFSDEIQAARREFLGKYAPIDKLYFWSWAKAIVKGQI